MHGAEARRGGALGCLIGLTVLLAATSAVAGDPSPDVAPIPGITSGSRLRATFRDGGEGALLFSGWFDSELGIPCTFIRTLNGQMRCLPSNTTVLRDSTCTMPVWALPRVLQTCSAPPPRYVTVMGIQGQPGCAAYELGSPYTGIVHSTSMGIGICSNAVRSDWATYYATGAEIPAERFVAAVIDWLSFDAGRRLLRTERADDGSSRVSIEVKDSLPVIRAWRTGTLPPDTFVYRGSGRLRVPLDEGPAGQLVEAALGGDFFDSEAQVACHPERFANGERCVPRALLSKVDVATSCTAQGDADWASVSDGME